MSETITKEEIKFFQGNAKFAASKVYGGRIPHIFMNKRDLRNEIPSLCEQVKIRQFASFIGRYVAGEEICQPCLKKFRKEVERSHEQH